MRNTKKANYWNSGVSVERLTKPREAVSIEVTEDNHLERKEMREKFPGNK